MTASVDNNTGAVAFVSSFTQHIKLGNLQLAGMAPIISTTLNSVSFYAGTMDPQGAHLYASSVITSLGFGGSLGGVGWDNQVYSYAIDPTTGIPSFTDVTMVQPNDNQDFEDLPLGLVTDAAGANVYVSLICQPNWNDPGLNIGQTFSKDLVGGANLVQKIPVTNGTFGLMAFQSFGLFMQSNLPCALARDPSGNCLINTTLADNVVTLIDVSPTAKNGSAVVANCSGGPVNVIPVCGDNSTSIAFDSTGKHAYIPGTGSNVIYVYDLDSTNKTLRNHVPNGRLKTGPIGPKNIVVDPSGSFAYVINSAGTLGVTAFAIDQNSGTLSAGTPAYTQVSGGPWPQAIVFVK
jgi:hypothetical protein